MDIPQTIEVLSFLLNREITEFNIEEGSLNRVLVLRDLFDREVDNFLISKQPDEPSIAGEAVTKGFRTSSTNAILVAVRNSDLKPRQRLLVRLALLNPDNRAEIEEYILQEAHLQKVVSTDVSIEAIDWNSIIAFIEKLLPLILKLIALFPK